jgi:hypothetical protein
MSGLAMMFFQDPSLLQFQKRMVDLRLQNQPKSVPSGEDLPSAYESVYLGNAVKVTIEGEQRQVVF